MSEVEKAVETVMTAFEEFKAANDARTSFRSTVHQVRTTGWRR
jgi:hypothetical protein